MYSRFLNHKNKGYVFENHNVSQLVVKEANVFIKSLIKFFKLNCSGSFVFFVLFCISHWMHAQEDPQFSQNMYNPVVVNPGFAGSSGRINVVASDRHQWVGFKDAPRTTVVGADMSLNLLGNPAGVSLVLLSDEIGFHRNTNIQAGVARKFDLAEGSLGLGLSVSIFNKVFDGAKIVTDPGGGTYHSGTDNLIPATEENGTTFDTGVGAFYSQQSFFAGISILHLFEPKPNFNDQLNVYIPRSFFLLAGYNHTLWEAPVEFKPSLFVKNAANSWQFDVNLDMVYRDRFWTGLTYRVQDAVVVLAGVELTSGVRIGYSYDITTSRLAKAGGGTHEIMVGYTFEISLDKREKRYKSVRFL
jgi:type IX secretion system PorP/SprF family membrane protein